MMLIGKDHETTVPGLRRTGIHHHASVEDMYHMPREGNHRGQAGDGHRERANDVCPCGPWEVN